jgi:hypothetical protein
MTNLSLKNYVTFGNKKLPKTTAIFNMNSATDCPSKKLGLCKLCRVCYAMKAEIQYPDVLPYRRRQSNFWTSCDAPEFVNLFNTMQARKKIKLNKLRISEAGDYTTQNDVNKMTEIANNLPVRSYCYTARTDLNFNGRGKLVVNLSGLHNINRLQAGEIDNLFCGLTAGIPNRQGSKP